MPQHKAPLSRVETISESRDLSNFDCGAHLFLNDWLKCFGLTNQRNESARAYVVHRNGSVVGYYSISAGSVAVGEQARKFYEHFDFEPSPIHELQLMLLMKDLRKALNE